MVSAYLRDLRDPEVQDAGFEPGDTAGVDNASMLSCTAYCSSLWSQLAVIPHGSSEVGARQLTLERLELEELLRGHLLDERAPFSSLQTVAKELEQLLVGRGESQALWGKLQAYGNRARPGMFVHLPITSSSPLLLQLMDAASELLSAKSCLPAQKKEGKEGNNQRTLKSEDTSKAVSEHPFPDWEMSTAPH